MSTTMEQSSSLSVYSKAHADSGKRPMRREHENQNRNEKDEKEAFLDAWACVCEGSVPRFNGDKKWMGDLRRILSARRNKFPMYRHCEPRTPATLRDHVSKSVRVAEAVAKTAKERGVSISSVQKDADRLIDIIGHNMASVPVKILGYTMQKLIFTIYEDVVFSKSELQQVREALEKTPVLLLPSHRSYMDFLVLSFLFYLNELPLPAIASGEDFLKMGPISWILRGCGAFFMRRSFKNDRLYWACFSEYVDTLITNGDAPMEFFVEGTRSRTGKSILPKNGLLGVALRPFFDARVGDITIFPVSISYEERMESHLYIDEMLGTPKPKESFKSALEARKVFNYNHGKIYVKLAPKISVREFTKDRVMRQEGLFSPGSAIYTPSHKSAIEALGREIVLAQQKTSVITVPAILSALVEMYIRDELQCISQNEIVQHVERLAKMISKRGFSVDLKPSLEKHAVIPKCPRDAIEMGLSSWLARLHPAASYARDGSIQFLTGGERHFEMLQLAHFRNEMLHVFSMEAILYLSIKFTGGRTRQELFNGFQRTVKIFYLEFILEGGVRGSFDKAVSAMIQFGHVHVSGDSISLAHDVEENEFQFALFSSLLIPMIGAYKNVIRVLRSDRFNASHSGLVALIRHKTSQISGVPSEHLSGVLIANCCEMLKRAKLITFRENELSCNSDELRNMEIYLGMIMNTLETQKTTLSHL
eukprot:m.11664 g.11664  ORF g.11664 m.11664 type:complete len:705 (+) comp4501_c0_seq2:24-2138(+)